MMEKMIVLLLVVFLVCACFAPVWAQEAVYQTAIELYRSWGKNPPDYIYGAWTTDGGIANMTFGIPDNEIGEAGRAEILNLVEDDSTASFVYQKYSRDELYQIFQEMHSYFDRNAGLITLAVDISGNQVKVEIFDQYLENPDTQAMISEIKTKYGDVVCIEYIDESHLPVPEKPISTNPIPTDPIPTDPIPEDPVPDPPVWVRWLMWLVLPVSVGIISVTVFH